MYCTYLDVIRFCGISEDDITEDDMNFYIEKATYGMIQDLVIGVVDEKIDGNINGINTTFTTDYVPMADINGDSVITGADLTVYGWTNKNDPSTRTTLTVSTVYDREGKIILTTAPASSYDQLTCDYYFYNQSRIPWTEVNRACAYLAGFLYVSQEYFLIPERYAFGVGRFTQKEPWNYYLGAYYRTLTRIRKEIITKETAEDMAVQRSGMQ